MANPQGGLTKRATAQIPASPWAPGPPSMPPGSRLLLLRLPHFLFPERSPLAPSFLLKSPCQSLRTEVKLFSLHVWRAAPTTGGEDSSAPSLGAARHQILLYAELLGWSLPLGYCRHFPLIQLCLIYSMVPTSWMSWWADHSPLLPALFPDFCNRNDFPRTKPWPWEPSSLFQAHFAQLFILLDTTLSIFLFWCLLNTFLFFCYCCLI